jgi:hypothetical protein
MFAPLGKDVSAGTNWTDDNVMIGWARLAIFLRLTECKTPPHSEASQISQTVLPRVLNVAISQEIIHLRASSVFRWENDHVRGTSAEPFRPLRRAQ